jgi:hypothetical protein
VLHGTVFAGSVHGAFRQADYQLLPSPMANKKPSHLKLVPPPANCRCINWACRQLRSVPLPIDAHNRVTVKAPRPCHCGEWFVVPL